MAGTAADELRKRLRVIPWQWMDRTLFWAIVVAFVLNLVVNVVAVILIH